MVGAERGGAWVSSRGAKRRGDLLRLPRVVPTLAMTSESAAGIALAMTGLLWMTFPQHIPILHTMRVYKSIPTTSYSHTHTMWVLFLIPAYGKGARRGGVRLPRRAMPSSQ